MAGQQPEGWKLLRAALATSKVGDDARVRLLIGPSVRASDRHSQRLARRCEDDLATIEILLDRPLLRLQIPVVAFVDRVQLPVLGRLGRRTSWIVLCQIGLIVSFVGLGASNPAAAIGWFAIFA